MAFSKNRIKNYICDCDRKESAPKSLFVRYHPPSPKQEELEEKMKNQPVYSQNSFLLLFFLM